MATLQQLKKYVGYTFEDWGGTTSKDYKTFETKFINYLKKVMVNNGGRFVEANRNHYSFSAVVQRKDNQFVYISISDVRYWRSSWYKTILVRTMAHEKDWTGGQNNNATLDNLEDVIKTVR